jgi:hypothetical protein
MKTIGVLIPQLATLFVVLSTHAQGAFQNLNFESANTGSLTFAVSIPVTSALPDWTVTIGGTQETQIGLNAPSTGAPAVMLIGPGYPAGLAPLDGNYSVMLTGSGVPTVPSISQTGLIPGGTESLLFKAEPQAPGFPGLLELEVGSQSISFTAVAAGPNYTLYGANISAWAGLTEPISFTAAEDTGGLNNWIIDDISFSTQAVPEPNTLELIFMGGMMFGVHGWRKRGR